MDLPAVASLVRAPAGAILADSRLVRRVIKRHRGLPGLGLQVPHAGSYVIGRAELLSIVDAEELGDAGRELPEQVILLPRPEPDEAEGAILRLWRAGFHARIHLEIARRMAAGELTDAAIRGRVHRIGQTEFDEIRLVLRGDGLLLPPYDDRETYAEFAALYLELSRFAPAQLDEMFPTLVERGPVDATLAEDVDAAALLAASRPEGAPSEPPAEREEVSPARRLRLPAAEDLAPAPVVAGAVGALVATAEAARQKGNLVRSALLCLRAAPAGGERGAALRDAARADLDRLGERIEHALRPRAERAAHGPPAEWGPALLALAERAIARGLFRRSEGRLLYDLLSACTADEKAIGKVDLVEWALSLGARPIARLLPATGEIRVARAIRAAAGKLVRARLPEAERERLEALVGGARHRAEANIRDALRPVLTATLTDVGLRPATVPERVALAKVVEELLDHAAHHGFLGIGVLRDAVSRNQIKMGDLAGARELFAGDALILADRRLIVALDGVYRGGEIYLRGLQKLSSLAFGTRAGRFFTLYAALPLGGAFTALEGASHVATAVAHALGLMPATELVVRASGRGIGRLEVVHTHIHLLSPASFAVCAALVFGLLHSAGVRRVGLTVARAIGWFLAAVFFHAPVWLATRPLVLAVVKSRAARAFGRYLAKPAAIAALAWRFTPLHAIGRPAGLAAAAAIFVLLNLALNSRLGALAEEVALDAVLRTVDRLRRHVLPGLFRLVADFFRRITDAIDRAIYTVDEWLRFREGQSRAVLAAKAVLGLGWFFVAYLARIYFNVMLEPQVNPIKHFPTVTVAAKMMLPIYGPLIEGLTTVLAPVVGAGTGKAIATPIVFSMPGVAGFLVWELKENYKLYASTRPALLRPVPIGHHGETMGALMKPGLHSGTVPKLYARLRRAARHHRPVAFERHKEALREVEEAVERFAERELCALLRASPRWQGGAIRVGRVVLASNRIRVELARGDDEPCCLAFEEQSGWLLAGLSRPGWAAALGDDDARLFENALAGFYQLAGVEMVREQIEAALPAGVPYDIAGEGLVVWPTEGGEVVYDLAGTGPLTPRVEGDGAGGLGPIDRAAIFFGAQPVSWSAWVAAWGEAPPRRVARGAPLLRRA